MLRILILVATMVCMCSGAPSGRNTDNLGPIPSDLGPLFLKAWNTGKDSTSDNSSPLINAKQMTPDFFLRHYLDSQRQETSPETSLKFARSAWSEQEYPSLGFPSQRRASTGKRIMTSLDMAHQIALQNANRDYINQLRHNHNLLSLIGRKR